MKTFLTKFFDLRAFDGFNLAAFFLVFFVFLGMDSIIPDDMYAVGAILSVALNIAILVYDQKVLVANGVEKPPRLFWCLIMPVYMFIREKTTGKKNLNVAWAYLLLLIVYFVSSFHIVTAQDPERVAADVCPVINTIDIFQAENITCKRAYNFSEQYEGFWKGRVHLSNNLIVNVTADYNQDKDSVYVQTQGVADAGY